MKANTHYTPTENGYSISGSSEIFNRTLYGSHKNDANVERYFTFTGDAPQVMGAVSDWSKTLWCRYSKCGVLNSGLSLTPGEKSPFYYSQDIDLTSRWFHNSEDIAAEFKNGWMEYELTQISSWFPDVNVNMEVYPLLPDDGFLVHYRITTDQRVIFTAGFGGITDKLARFEYRDEPKRKFMASNCEGNTVEIGKNRACVKHTDGTTMHIATSFLANFEHGSAKSLSEPYPGLFLGSKPENENDDVVKISTVIEPDCVLDGYIIAIRNVDDATLDKWLAMENPIGHIKQQIHKKHTCIGIKTPEHPLDLTIAPTVIALDAAWHENSFHHGAFAYHAPFLGWRNWYAPTTLGWADRVEKTMSAHLDQLPKGPIEEEKIWYDQTPRRGGDSRSQVPSQFHSIENSPGFMLYFLNPICPGPYNMQECAFDMMMYHIEWTGNLDISKKYYEDLCMILDWEERVLDTNNDGLYQNFLNTWISDGHNYNGAGCSQASSYNYRANMVMAKIAKRLGYDNEKFIKRAEKIKKAVNEKMWLPNKGVLAESIDTIGNCLVHDAPELSTIYLAIDCDIIDDFKAYTMLRYSENHIKNITTPASNGRLAYSSNWLPKQYSNCGIFPAENAHLALAYYKLGLKEKGKEIIDGIVDCYFMGRNPGMAAHIQSSRCTCDLGDMDFTDVMSPYLRVIIEGLFGIRINNLDNNILIAPAFPDDWDDASLSLKDIALYYSRMGEEEIFDISCNNKEEKIIKIPMRATTVDAVMLDGEVVPYTVKSATNNSFIIVKTDKTGRFQLRVMHGNGSVPTVSFSNTVLLGNETIFEVKDGEIVEYLDISETLENIEVVGNKIYAKAKDVTGHHTMFIHVVSGEYDTWLAADYEIVKKDVVEEPLPQKQFRTVDIKEFFNCNMKDIHDRSFFSPRPKEFSVGVFQNGRYAWNWNHGGANMVVVDDSALRQANGLIHTPSGIPFITPDEGENVACVSIWDNFPTDVTIPLNGAGQEIALLFVSTTNPMQTLVENVRITVTYKDGEATSTKLVYPINIDDWLTPALQIENEIFYFSDYNHATVQRIRINPNKELASIKIEAIANEVIMGVMGISIS